MLRQRFRDEGGLPIQQIRQGASFFPYEFFKYRERFRPHVFRQSGIPVGKFLGTWAKAVQSTQIQPLVGKLHRAVYRSRVRKESSNLRFQMLSFQQLVLLGQIQKPFIRRTSPNRIT